MKLTLISLPWNQKFVDGNQYKDTVLDQSLPVYLTLLYDQNFSPPKTSGVLLRYQSMIEYYFVLLAALPFQRKNQLVLDHAH